MEETLGLLCKNADLKLWLTASVEKELIEGGWNIKKRVNILLDDVIENLKVRDKK